MSRHLLPLRCLAAALCLAGAIGAQARPQGERDALGARCQAEHTGRVVGGIAGAIIGRQLGEDSTGRVIGTVGGAVVGGLIGGEIGRRIDADDPACRLPAPPWPPAQRGRAGTGESALSRH